MFRLIDKCRRDEKGWLDFVKKKKGGKKFDRRIEWDDLEWLK